MKGQFGFVGTLHPTHRPAVRGSHLSIGARMLRWYQLYRQRRELAGLSDAMLRTWACPGRRDAGKRAAVLGRPAGQVNPTFE